MRLANDRQNRATIFVWFAVVAAFFQVPTYAQQISLPVLRSPLAGYRYYLAPSLAPWLLAGEPLQLLREPSNPFDANAIEVRWQGNKLGYLPRRKNAALAWIMDRGEHPKARIAEATRRRSRRGAIEIDVYLE